VGLRHGARQLIDELEDREEEILALLDLAAGRVKYNPDYAIEQIRKAQDKIRGARKLRDERLPEMLQKAAPSLEKRVEELERRMDELLNPNVIRMRKVE
jgi:hypothetical protein